MTNQTFTEEDFLKENNTQKELKEKIADIINEYSASRIMTRTARMLIAEKIVEFLENKKGIQNL